MRAVTLFLLLLLLATAHSQSDNSIDESPPMESSNESALSHGGPPPGIYSSLPSTTPGLPVPSFLRSVSEQARREFFLIFQVRSLTKQQQLDAVNAWAKQYKVEEQVAQFEKERDAHEQETQNNVTALIGTLPDAFQKLSAIQSNRSLTRDEERSEIAALSKQIGTETFAAVISVVDQVVHRPQKEQHNMMTSNKQDNGQQLLGSPIVVHRFSDAGQSDRRTSYAQNYNQGKEEGAYGRGGGRGDGGRGRGGDEPFGPGGRAGRGEHRPFGPDGGRGRGGDEPFGPGGRGGRRGDFSENSSANSGFFDSFLSYPGSSTDGIIVSRPLFN